MKLTAILMLCLATCLCGCSSSYSFNVDNGQTSSIYLSEDGAEVVARLNNTTIAKLAEELGEQLGCRVAIASEVDGDRRLTMEIEANGWDEALAAIAAELNLKVERTDNTSDLTLVPASAEASTLN
ncbi:MAG: hypothetical protein AAGF97_11115 [Planctomycetota bacterium]